MTYIKILKQKTKYSKFYGVYPLLINSKTLKLFNVGFAFGHNLISVIIRVK